ncbi:MAG: diaminopimelate epimerase [Planctomycetota bacterium]|nr:diaminopimelate epimerase [Planctomycetota bacterium]
MIAFTKMHGCGNDYVLVDDVAGGFPVARAGELARRWSDRRFGVGADGLILLTRDDGGGLRMQMWNADGSRGAMCGNGLRCVARFAAAGGHETAPSFVIATDAGPRRVELLSGADGGVRAEMGVVTVTAARTLEVAGRRLDFTLGSAGNPHAVTFVEDVDRAPVSAVGAAMQEHPAFCDGVNVEFVERVGEGRLRQRTYERGSGETLSCGTGAAVSALAARRAGFVKGDRVCVALRGGALKVIGSGASLVIEGPTRTVFTGAVEP